MEYGFGLSDHLFTCPGELHALIPLSWQVPDLSVCLCLIDRLYILGELRALIPEVLVDLYLV